MKMLIQNPHRRNEAGLGLIAAAILAAGLMLSATVGTAEAAGKSGAAKPPAPRAAALTAQEQIARNQQAVPRPKKAFNDKTCTGRYRPRSCFPHSH